MLKQLALGVVTAGFMASAALADPLADAQAICKTHAKGQNTINIVGQPPITWPAYDRPECDDLEKLTNKNIPPEPNRKLDGPAVIGAVMALVTGVHPVTLSPLARYACDTQGRANIAVELAESAGDSITAAAASAASAAIGARCVW